MLETEDTEVSNNDNHSSSSKNYFVGFGGTAKFKSELFGNDVLKIANKGVRG